MAKKPGRPRNTEPTRKVEPRLSPGTYACLEWLVKKKRYGSTPTEVAKYLITREIDDMERAGVFRDMESS